MASPPPDQDELISFFVEMTGTSPEIAKRHLVSTSWDVESAVEDFMNTAENNTNHGESLSGAPNSSGRSKNESSAANPAAPPQNAPGRKKFATLGDLGGSGNGGGHAGNGPDGDDSEDSDENQDLYAGGEKSGLAVENPDDLKKKIIERARKNVPRPGGDSPRPPKTHFTGTARTLGGDDAPSEVVQDPNPKRPQRELVERHLHFWEDGFSVDDGPLYRLDDPKNAAVLAQIKSGRAPLSILNVQLGQEVDVKLEQHAEKYVAPKKKYKPFEGAGQRLGSPTPGFSESPKPPPTANPVQPASVSPSQPSASVTVSESEPTLSLQIRLGDGTRLVSRFNTTHTIGDVYSFVDSASANSRNRPWVLMTTFPSKELQERSQELGSLPEFKRGGVVVQKWQ